MEPIAITLPDLGKESEIPAPEEYDYWKSRENRIFYVDFEINETMQLIDLTKSIVQMNFEERDIPKEQLKPIYLFIHTYGGRTDQAFYMCDIIKSSRIPIYTVAMDVAMSAGFLIFIAGKKRYAFPHSQLLVHSGYLQLSGTVEQVDDAYRSTKKENENTKKYILDNTGIEEKLYNKNKSRDWYLTADELIQYKVADELITDLSTLFE